jgi:hypothetical protein
MRTVYTVGGKPYTALDIHDEVQTLVERGAVHQDECKELLRARVLRVVTVAAHERYL